VNVISRSLACVVALVLAGPAVAQTYPSKPVKVIVPFAPAGPTDVIARLLGQKLSEALGQQFVVENQAGAGGNIGIGNAAKAAPDGYTILVVSSSFVVNPSLYDKIPYDPNNDFAPITMAAASPNVLVVNPSVAAKSVKELVALINANPGKYSYAMPGAGTTPHLSGELLKLSAKLDLVTVPFNGAGPAVQSVVGGHTPIGFTALPPTTPQVKAGTLRALAVTGAKRSAALPDVPTMAEAGFPGQEADTLQGVLVPAATPKEIVALLHRELVKAIAAPDLQQRFAELGFDAAGTTPEQFAAQIKDEIAKWGKVIRAADIKVQ
jgi:tripartite-type tricarboxylate transporter receptor subunit TctC